MRQLILTVITAVLLLGPAVSQAETHASKYGRYTQMLQGTKMHSLHVAPFLDAVDNVYYYDTATELLAASPSEGKIGYAIDTNAFYLRSGSSWLSLSVLTGSNGGTIDNATNNVFTFGENSEDLKLTFSTNATAWSTTTGATTMSFTGITLAPAAINTPLLATHLREVRFCGQGPNATTADYIGPVTVGEAYAANYEFGGAACDAKDSTTEATADAPIDSVFAYKAVAMVCATACGTNDTMTVQLRSAAADVAGATCTITLAGAAAQCTVRLPAAPSIAANATVAVKLVNSTDDDCSAGDVECRVYLAY